MLFLLLVRTIASHSLCGLAAMDFRFLAALGMTGKGGSE